MECGNQQHQNVQAGPKDPSLLTLQNHHRSEFIWLTNSVDNLSIKRCDRCVWERAIDPRIQKIFVQAGFYGVYKAGYWRVNQSLITALIERWRPETHTFHLPIGEVTITLQDVEILWGLPIDGAPLLPSEDRKRTVAQWQDLCDELLGFRPNENSIDRTKLKVTSILPIIAQPLPIEATELQIAQRARLYMMVMIGGGLFADTSGNKVSLYYLDYIRDFDICRKLSWGGAVLSYLYHTMCHATYYIREQLGGPFTLLQLWAWERIPLVRPQVLKGPRNNVIHIDEASIDPPLPGRPRGAKWDRYMSPRIVGGQGIINYRNKLDHLEDNQFIWEPYSMQDIDQLPDYCRRGMNIWRARAPLIWFNCVEMHYPDRVLRQFGLHQDIPIRPNPVGIEHQHVKNSSVHYGVSPDHIVAWNARHNNIVHAPDLRVPIPHNDPYLVWYRSVTRLLISPNRAAVETTTSHGKRSNDTTYVPKMLDGTSLVVPNVSAGDIGGNVKQDAQVEDSDAQEAAKRKRPAMRERLKVQARRVGQSQNQSSNSTQEETT